MLRRIPLAAILLALLCAGASARPSDSGGGQLDHGSVGADGGFSLPLGNISDDFEPGPVATIFMRMKYWEGIDFVLLAGYQRDRISGSDLFLHHATGSAGLLFPLPFPGGKNPARLGGGIAFFFVRASEPVGGLLLDDNESDFGHWFRLETPALRWRTMGFRLYAQQQTAWTLKKASHFAAFGASAEAALW